MYLFLIVAIEVIIAWRLGDWRNWKKYQSTILYFITFDLLYNFLCYNYMMWEYQPSFIFPNHTLMNIFIMTFSYPSIVLLYLGNFPTKQKFRFIWIFLWTVVFLLLEFLGLKIFREIKYLHGWNLIVDFIFCILMFSLLRLHYKRPLLTYGLSILATIVLLIIFKVPISKMK